MDPFDYGSLDTFLQGLGVAKEAIKALLSNQGAAQNVVAPISAPVASNSAPVAPQLQPGHGVAAQQSLLGMLQQQLAALAQQQQQQQGAEAMLLALLQQQQQQQRASPAISYDQFVQLVAAQLGALPDQQTLHQLYLQLLRRR